MKITESQKYDSGRFDPAARDAAAGSDFEKELVAELDAFEICNMFHGKPVYSVERYKGETYILTPGEVPQVLKSYINSLERALLGFNTKVKALVADNEKQKKKIKRLQANLGKLHRSNKRAKQEKGSSN